MTLICIINPSGKPRNKNTMEPIHEKKPEIEPPRFWVVENGGGQYLKLEFTANDDHWVHHIDNATHFSSEQQARSASKRWSRLNEFVRVAPMRHITNPILNKKPPTGIEPKWILAERRRDEICEAVDRYNKAGFTPPNEWIIEIADITHYLKCRHQSNQ